MTHDAPAITYGPSPFPNAPAGHRAPTANPAPFAGWWRRVGANLLDGLINSSPYVVGLVIAAILSEPAVDALGNPTREPTTAGLIVFLAGVVVTWGVTIWNRFIRQGRTGRSLGKSALGIRLVSARTGAPIGAGLAFGRDIAHFLDGIFYVGYLWPLWDPMRQTFADKIVGSVVVRD